MTDFSVNELQHIITMSNMWDCPECAGIRMKAEKMIAELDKIPEIEHRILGGVPVTIEHIRG
jgi:hypothetical protein